MTARIAAKSRLAWSSAGITVRGRSLWSGIRTRWFSSHQSTRSLGAPINVLIANDVILVEIGA